jgi:FkbM family methyltransferase
MDWAAKWRADGSEHTLRVHYPLQAGSTVFDVGGYDGGWTADLIKHTGVFPHVFIFEPLPNGANAIKARFPDGRVRIVNAALSDRDGSAGIRNYGHESSMHTDSGDLQIQTLDIASFIQNEGITKIDIMSVNVEGHEYVILNRLLDTGLVNIIDNLQIQFHDFIPGAVELRDSIRARLALTHIESYCYPFVWESWKRHRV